MNKIIAVHDAIQTARFGAEWSETLMKVLITKPSQILIIKKLVIYFISRSKENINVECMCTLVREIVPWCHQYPDI